MLSILHIRSIGEAILNFILITIGGVLAYFKIIYMDNILIFHAIFAVVLVDNILGQIIGYRTKVRDKKSGKMVSSWQTKKALKGVWYLMGYSTIVATVLTIQKAFPEASFMTTAVTLPIMIFQLISILKNASLIGILPKGLLLEILQHIDNYKNNRIADAESTITEVNEPINTTTNGEQQN